jgi:serine/threonine protein kinase/Tfp pilus assembly protein PilF
MHAPAAKICDTCGSSLDLETPSGFCPACLLSTALNGSDEEVNGAGASICDYEILSEIARGGMGIVYLARQRIPARVVALKMILPAHINSARAIARFSAEAEAAASLDHPGILPIYAVGEKDGAPFYSMKFAEGGSLASRLATFRDKPRDSADLIATLARATAHAHERGILHRDLKPGNVLFDGTDKAFVSDFGLAKWLERECDLTQTLAILGTPHYMAPEQSAHSRSLTPAADIYSLGAILFHLLTSRVPFRGENALEVLRQAAERPAPRPRSLNRNVPADLETICLKCLEKNPLARYSSATALADDLDRFLARRAILARRANPITQASRWARRNQLVALLCAASMVLLISLLLVLRTPPPQKAPKQILRSDNTPGEKSIAVLPFENLSEDKSNDYLASGIQDELLVDLSKIGDLKVISRNSVQPYKEGPRDLREIGKALGVRTILQGNVRTAGKRARINVQLSDTTNDTQIWAESFDREVTDVLSMESELALRIAAALQTKLSTAEKAAIETLPTRDPEAYDFYLRARESVYSIRTRADSGVDIHRAIDLLNQAVARDPKFALAYSFLAQMYLSDFESNGEPAQLERARTNIETALRLAPDLGDAHLARGIYFNYGLRDYERSSAEFAIARSALPNNAECLHWSGLLERRLGRWKEGLNYQLKAATLDPRDGMVQRDLLVTYCLLRNYAEADRTIERAIIVSPQQTSFFRMKQAEVALMKGDLIACRTALQSLPSEFEFNGFVAFLRARLALFERDYQKEGKILDEALNKLGLPKAEWWVMRDQAYLARAQGDRPKTQAAWERARKFWEAQLARNPDDWQKLSWIAAADAALGRKEEAKRGIEKAVKQFPSVNDPVDRPTLGVTEALVNAWCGDQEQALAQLAELAKRPAGPEPGDLKLNPRWDDLRGDPRFEKVVVAAGKPIATP